MPHAHAHPHANANAAMNLSEAGRLALTHAEAIRHDYYNDQANNCTYGIGTLVHYGPCTATETATPVTDAMIANSLSRSIADAERIVRRSVTDHPLTQAQFDAAVRFIYNTGPGGQTALHPANTGDMPTVASRMQTYVQVCRHDPHTGRRIPGTCRVSHGLVNRRAAEAAPFRQPPAAPHLP